jgi:hypothetical protein
VFLQSKSKKWMKNPTNHGLLCVLGRANLKENGGRYGGRKQDLLNLAILYFDGVFVDFVSDLGANSTPATITGAERLN